MKWNQNIHLLLLHSEIVSKEPNCPIEKFHTESRAKKNPSCDNFLKNIKSIDHPDGMLSEGDWKRSGDTDRYREIYRWRCVRCGKMKVKVVRRRDNGVDEEEDERGMKFLFLSRAFITRMELILVVPCSLCYSLSVSFSIPWPRQALPDVLISIHCEYLQITQKKHMQMSTYYYILQNWFVCMNSIRFYKSTTCTWAWRQQTTNWKTAYQQVE